VDWDDGRFTVTLTHCVTGSRTELSADALLVATGTTPCTDALGLENTDVRLTAGGYIAVDDHLQTHVPGVYALGDCIGRHFFRHAVNFEGEYLVRSVFDASGEGPLDYGAMPYAVFTVPEVAGVGRTEDDLIAAGLGYVAGRATYPDSNVGLARQLDHGLAKLLFARGSGRLLGAHVVGEQAATLIHMLITAMHLHATLDDLLDMIYIHPALPEIIRDAARDAHAHL
jgi:dihydrolipoamide dehydrogenase